MIADTIKNYKLYTGLGDNFREAFDFINTQDSEKIPPGRYELKGSMYYMIQNFETKPESEGFFESHCKYIDLQYVIRGRERIDYNHVSALTLRDPYDEGKDMVVYDGAGYRYILNPGFFVVYFPEDAHMPNLWAAKGPEKIFKAVVKIPVDK